MPYRFERNRTSDRVPEFWGILDNPQQAYAKSRFGEVVAIGSPDKRYERLILAQRVGNQSVDDLVIVSLFSRLAGGGATIIPVTETGLREPLDPQHKNWDAASREITTVYGQGLYLVEEPIEVRVSRVATVVAEYFDQTTPSVVAKSS